VAGGGVLEEGFVRGGGGGAGVWGGGGGGFAKHGFSFAEERTRGGFSFLLGGCGRSPSFCKMTTSGGGSAY